MKNKIFDFIKQILSFFNISLIRYSALEKLKSDSIELGRISFAPLEIDLIKKLNKSCAVEILENWPLSKSQLRQDLFVLSHFLFKKEGFFVEFGATNGVDLSNTFLMEKHFSWTGILAEPAKCWHAKLHDNRSCKIETKCVWTETGSKVSFIEADEAELSTVREYSDCDMHGANRENGFIYEVETISLYDLLKQNNAPKSIEYMSIDTEGSEYDILETFPFDEYKFGIITVEHNYSESRNKIHALLTKFGYRRIFEDISSFDDWYINPKFGI